MSRISSQIDAYRAGTLPLDALATSLSRVHPNFLPAPGIVLPGTWDEVFAAYQTGLLSPSDYAVIKASRDAALLARRSPSFLSPPAPTFAPQASPATPLHRPRLASLALFVGLAFLLLPLIPFVIALDIVIVNALHFNVLQDFIFMLLSLPATYALEYLFFTSALPRVRARFV